LLTGLIENFGGTSLIAMDGDASNVAVPRIFRYTTLSGEVSLAVTVRKISSRYVRIVIREFTVATAEDPMWSEVSQFEHR
jgi:hypothetical protein